MIDIRQRLLVVFQAEAKEHLARIRSILDQDGAATAGPNLDEVFRRAHSLKGAARAVDLRIVEILAHPLETLFARVREGGLRLDPPVMVVVHQALDGIEDGVATQISGLTPVEPVAVLQALNALIERRALPVSDKVVETPVGKSPDPAATGALPPNRATAGNPDTDTVRVSASIIERLHRSSGQLTTEGLRQTLLAEKLKAAEKQVAEIGREWELVRKASGAALRRLDTNPELARLARYLNFVERQVVAVTKDTREMALFQQRSAWSLRNLGEQLQQDVCGARMVLAESVFDNFGKMMRDLARDEGKEIDFKVTGLDVKADRMVLQALKDPLMHLLRNTLAHGIESAAERTKAGKPPAGAVSLRLETQGNKLIVTVDDDGRGVDLKRVTEAAVAKRLISGADAAALSPEDRRRLIFHPGISTTRAVTELSGRGMGLNVVAEAVGHLQGTVDIQPVQPAGTRFIISVPLAISSNRLVLVKCREQRFALVSHSIEKLCRVKIKEIVNIDGQPSINFQGALLPLTSLAQVLNMNDNGVLEAHDAVNVVVLRSGEKRVAVAVDAFDSEIEGVIKDLSPIVMKAGKLSGGILMGDGSVVLVLIVAELVETFLRLDRKPLLKTAAPSAGKSAPVILVVDDSMTTRTLEKSILEAHGYKVLLAVDGMEALAQLRSAQVDLIISDIEMPRLDGFGLLQELKNDPQLAKIPIVLVTSLEKREDKERGLALGADGYIVKRKFDQKVLLETVRQIL